ncbi:autotransporter assembly complex protein TamA [Desulfovibrio inopinatus]|uniref:autotransporter assembly complex protein TamA n=1 Tax=Desulfovibrio inopinatus TaxID=102109 RepID=UPI00040B3F0B|nr:autotransporter assembly complex family protein [Desulfovibrio inopinatus]
MVAVTGCLFCTVAPVQAEDDEAIEKLDLPGPEVRYTVSFVGIEELEFVDLLHKVSKTVEKESDPPASLLLLKARADGDVSRFLEVFRSKGYFIPQIAVKVTGDNKKGIVTFDIKPGPRFAFGSVKMVLSPDDEDARSHLPSLADLKLSPETPYTASAVVDAQGKIESALKNNGYPFAKQTNREVAVDLGSESVNVEYFISQGKRSNFGTTSFSGSDRVDEDYLRSLIPWKTGQLYDLRLLDSYQRTLINLGLFSIAIVDVDKNDVDSDVANIVVNLTERKPRTIKGGVGYQTDSGPEATLSWEHRNLFGKGEKLSLSGKASLLENYAELKYTQPQVLSKNTNLVVTGKFADEDKESFTGRNLSASASFEHKFSPLFKAGFGLGYRFSYVQTDEAKPWEEGATYEFVSLPLGVGYENPNDPISPSAGGKYGLTIEPFYDLKSGSSNFLRSVASVIHFWGITDSPRIVWANRLLVGSEFGAGRDDIPPDLRFYAGGGGSIRGYPYQTVGPLRGSTPLGGRSLLEFSTEFRIRIMENVGIVPFLDGGSAFESEMPLTDQAILFGAGLGVRVYTPIGPIRLDVATPLNRRPDIDDIVQFYISLGQAF